MSYKIERVNSILSQEVSTIINNKMRNLGLGLVTITAAECSSDMRSANIWISVFDKDKKKSLEILNKNIYEIQQELNRRLEMKYVPKIFFRLDKSEDNYAHIDKLIKDEEKKIE